MSGTPGRQDGPVRSGPDGRTRLVLAMLVVAFGTVVVIAKVGFSTIAEFVHGIVVVATREPPPPPKVLPAEPKRPPYDPLGSLSPDLRADLIRTDAPIGKPFRFLVGIPPSAICSAMNEAGLKNPGWQEAAGEWICESDLIAVKGTGEKPGIAPDTLYFVGRGPAEDRVTILRFKLNIDDPEGAEAGREALLAALGKLEGPLAWSVSAAVEDAIRRYRKLSLYDRGVIVEVHPEEGDVERLNVVLMLETPARRLPSDHFAPLPPIEEVGGGG